MTEYTYLKVENVTGSKAIQSEIVNLLEQALQLLQFESFTSTVLANDIALRLEIYHSDSMLIDIDKHLLHKLDNQTFIDLLSIKYTLGTFYGIRFVFCTQTYEEDQPHIEDPFEE